MLYRSAYFAGVIKFALFLCVFSLCLHYWSYCLWLKWRNKHIHKCSIGYTATNHTKYHLHIVVRHLWLYHILLFWAIKEEKKGHERYQSICLKFCACRFLLDYCLSHPPNWCRNWLLFWLVKQLVLSTFIFNDKML